MVSTQRQQVPHLLADVRMVSTQRQQVPHLLALRARVLQPTAMRLLERLHSGRVILMDGAMGTELICRGARPGAECLELRNLTHPEDIWAIHQAYLESGAECLTTNTFQANSCALARYGLHDRLDEIWQVALHLAREHAGYQPLVLADVGPWPGPLDPDVDRAILRACRGADAVLLETWSDPRAAEFFAVMRGYPRIDANGPYVPLLASFTFRRSAGGRLETFSGVEPEGCVEPIEPWADALGANCGVDIDMDDLLEIVSRYRAVTDLPLFVRPNAGTPDAEGRYPRTPVALAAKLPALLDAGVAMVGGCCGTTPAHIAAFHEVIVARQVAPPSG